MVDSTFRERLDQVREACGYETQTDFAKAIGLKSAQALNNWYKRNGVGRGGAGLRAATGVSIDWLETGVGEAFPSGPKRRRLTREGSTEPASDELKDGHRLPNDIKALQWIAGAVVGHLLASQPDAAGELIHSLEALPKAYQSTGPGGALLAQLKKAKAGIEAEAARKALKLRGNAPTSQRSRP